MWPSVQSVHKDREPFSGLDAESASNLAVTTRNSLVVRGLDRLHLGASHSSG